MRTFLLSAIAAFGLLAMGLEGPPADGSIFPVAHAQQGPMGNQPFTFNVRNNSSAASLAIYMRQLKNQNNNSTTSATTAPGGAGSYIVNNYNSSTVGTLNDISQTLGNGSSASLGAQVDQLTQGNQTSSTEGHQALGDVNNGNTLNNNAQSQPTQSSP